MNVSLKKNIIANFGGSVFATLIGILFVPIYIKLMGVEAYGLVGVFTTLQMVFSVLDLGLSQTLSREIARLGPDTRNKPLILDTAKTFELIYWIIGGFLVLAIAALSKFISHSWLNPVGYTPDELRGVVVIMALTLGLRWPGAIYTGGLIGMQKQVLTNVLGILFGTLQSVGAVAVLYFIKPSINTFFFWQAATSFLQVIILKRVMWRELAPQGEVKFSLTVLKGVWRFAAGMSGIAVLSTILTQLDKIILSKILSLVEFGYYTFGSAVALALYKIIGPVFITYYPRLTELVAKQQKDELIRTYHQACQLIASIVLPVAATLAFFSQDIVLAWTGNSSLAEKSNLIISILVVGNTLNGLMNVPYALQLAFGWTSLAFYTNIVAVSILTPALYFAAKNWGAIGASLIWVILNFGYILVPIHLMHRKILPSEKWAWYLFDVLRPAVVAVGVVYLGHRFAPVDLGRVTSVMYIGTVFLCAVLATVWSSDMLRGYIVAYRASLKKVPGV